MAITWEQAQVDFAPAQDAAVRDNTCFCVCGCRAEGVPHRSILGSPIPGLCARCKKGTGHDRVASAAMLVTYEPEPVEEAVAPRTTPEQHQRAVAYLTSRSDEPTRLVSELFSKVERGGTLTDRQVEAVLAAEAAEARDYERLHKRLVKDHYKQGKATDLTRLHIPESVKDGDYAVLSETGDMVRLHVDRTLPDQLRGHVVVSIILGDKSWYGIQPPAKWWKPNPVYKGWFPQLVADLIANPDGARHRFEEVSRHAA